MQMIAESYREVSLLVEINLDRLLVPLVLAVALTGMAMLGSVVFEKTMPTPVYIHQP